MPRRALIAALMLIGLGVFLGTTIFREDIAYAAQLVSADIVGPLDAQGNVKVHEQGTANVNVTNRALAVSGTVNVDVTTSKLLATPPGGLPVPTGNTIGIGTVDTASSSQVRIAADARQSPYCNDVFLRVDLEDAAGPSRHLLDIDLCQQQTGVVARVVDIPGTELSFSVQNQGDFDVTVDVTVWGR